MAANSLTDYEKRVGVAKEPLDAFHTRLIFELDEEKGAFPQWHGHSDWKTLILIADYLIQSVSGAADSLVAASYAAKIHEEACFSLSYDFREALRKFSNEEDVLRELDLRGAKSRKREQRIHGSAEHCFFHLGQALDRFAAVLVIVGGFGYDDVVRLHFTDVQALANVAMKPKDDADLKRVEPRGTAGRAAQQAILSCVNQQNSYGPQGWLEWLRDTRNALTHRSPGMRTNMAIEGQMLRFFYRQPKWSEKQTFIYARGAKPDPFVGGFIPSSSVSILNGLCDSVAAYVADMVRDVAACWDSRQANPSMIVQQGRQWPVVKPPGPQSTFEGYSTDIPKSSKKLGTLRLNKNDAKRFAAARAMDDRSHEWDS